LKVVRRLFRSKARIRQLRWRVGFRLSQLRAWKVNCPVKVESPQFRSKVGWLQSPTREIL
jgi:hypothetical protein